MSADHENVQWLHGHFQMSIVELADTCGVSEALVRELRGTPFRHLRAVA